MTKTPTCRVLCHHPQGIWCQCPSVSKGLRSGGPLCPHRQDRVGERVGEREVLVDRDISPARGWTPVP